ncbi:MAG: hypothetical protein EPO09_17365 [Aquabacterium sp.]|uniref:hypothetical protein n=1 Tax=Aquabacterium sp. TaxID=1872578 RepID=UPI0012147099|nr:hypothetical protein [Aquabacterium sp.]TAK89464.1 MAG: hypothetical protein EPO09_17365 [Aquabacterium sp.]
MPIHHHGAQARRLISLTTLTLATLMAVSVGAHAEDKGNREREALRRAQQTLRQTQEERDALASEKANLAQAKDKAESELKQTGSRIRTVEAQARGTKARLDQVEANLKAKDEALQAAEQREQALQAELQKTQLALKEQTRTAASVSGLLAETSKENEGLKAQNKSLYGIGLNLVEVVRTQSPAAWLRAHDSLLGFKGVEAENLAEKFRTMLDDARYNTPTLTATAAP